jgi:hypothetical protein
MKRTLGRPRTFAFVEDPGGERVTCHVPISASGLIEHAPDADEVLVVSPGERLPAPAQRIADLLDAARQIIPRHESADHVRRQVLSHEIDKARDALRAQGRHLVSGSAQRPGAPGGPAETACVIAAIPIPVAVAAAA